MSVTGLILNDVQGRLDPATETAANPGFEQSFSVER